MSDSPEMTPAAPPPTGAGLAFRPAPLASLGAALGIALLCAQRSDYSVAGAVLLGIAALPIAVRRLHASPGVFAVVAVVLLALATAPSSDLPGMTAQAVVRLGIVAVGAALAAAAWGPREFSRLVMFGTGLTVSLSVAMGLAGISAARGSEGLLQGVTSHPNVLAFVCVICALASAASFRPREDVLFPGGFGALSLLGLVLTESATGALGLAVALAVAVGLKALRPSPPLQQHAALVTTITLLVIGLAIGASSYAAITEALGRDPTLTGRTEIWQAVIGHIRDAPIIGHGLGATWGDDAPVTHDISREIGFRAFHSHNGYLDVTLQLGLLGLALMAGALLWTLWATSRAALRGASAWVPATAALLLVYSLSETVVLQYGGWALLCYAAFSAARGPSPLVPPAASGGGSSPAAAAAPRSDQEFSTS